MSKLFNKILLLVYKHFKILWVLLSLIALFVAFLINYKLTYEHSYKNLAGLATTIGNKVDELTEDLFQEIYALPLYGKDISTCKTSLYRFMEHATINNPRIAGIIISDSKSKPICSTIPDIAASYPATNYSRTIFGPFVPAAFDQPVYLIQQKMGNYYIGVVVVSSVIQDLLQTQKNNASSLSIYNPKEHKNLIRMEFNELKNLWNLSNNRDDQTPENTQVLFASNKLQSIDGVLLIAFENNKTTYKKLFYIQTITILLVLLLSRFLYVLIKKNIRKRYSLHRAIKYGIKNKEFYPVYQPVFDAELKTFSGVEVLLRWLDSEEQIIMPDFFIAEAENSGLIIPITLQIIEHSFKELQGILKQQQQFHIAFNFSDLHFTDPKFFKQFRILVNNYEISPNQILLEITERSLFNIDNLLIKDNMNKLRNAGFSLAVDDYGTGHASISYLQHFPFNYLKIDKIFIQAIGTKAITESLNHAIINMAKHLNLTIIAEGVETEEQVKYLSENGVRYLQGWFFSKAISIEKLKRLLNGETQ